MVNGLTLKKTRTERYLAKIMTDTDYVDYQALLTNTPVQAECLLHNLELVTRNIGFYDELK